MTALKKIGIWLDHSNAYLTTWDGDTLTTTTLDSPFTHEEKVQSLHKSEHLMHNKEQHEQATYYKKLGDIIRNYNEVLLFGPTNAKSELFNSIKEDHNFADIKIEVQQTDKMDESEQQHYVRAYFSKHTPPKG